VRVRPEAPFYGDHDVTAASRPVTAFESRCIGIGHPILMGRRTRIIGHGGRVQALRLQSAPPARAAAQWLSNTGSCLSAREASAAMALVTAATEPEHEIIRPQRRKIAVTCGCKSRGADPPSLITATAGQAGVWFIGNSRPVRHKPEQPWECNSPHADHFGMSTGLAGPDASGC
jgi:hypothetical protein